MNGCIGCNRCIEAALRKDGKIYYTEDSIKNCPRHLLRICGEDMESGELCERLLKNKRLLVNGGITFSGGEPFVQSDFMLACLKQLKGQLHTAIQTCGYCNNSIFKEALKLADYFLFDLKLAEEAEHQKYTGVSNQRILENFRMLAASDKEFVVRIPLIPSVTDTKENILGIIEILKTCGVSYVELMPYNKLAGGKYKLLGRSYQPDFDDKKEVCLPVDLLTENNIAFRIL